MKKIVLVAAAAGLMSLAACTPSTTPADNGMDSMNSMDAMGNSMDTMGNDSMDTMGAMGNDSMGAMGNDSMDAMGNDSMDAMNAQ